VGDQEKDKVKIEDLPVPLKDLNPDEQEEVKGGTNVNPSRPQLLTRLLTQGLTRDHQRMLTKADLAVTGEPHLSGSILTAVTLYSGLLT